MGYNCPPSLSNEKKHPQNDLFHTKIRIQDLYLGSGYKTFWKMQDPDLYNEPGSTVLNIEVTHLLGVRLQVALQLQGRHTTNDYALKVFRNSDPDPYTGLRIRILQVSVLKDKITFRSYRY
jgi:hypothetical protein